MITEHIHPITGVTIRGRKLIPGEILTENDVFAGMSKWMRIPPVLVGVSVKDTSPVWWIRPSKDLESVDDMLYSPIG